MSTPPDSAKPKSPAGPAPRGVHRPEKRPVEQGRQAAPGPYRQVRKESRWIRFVHYVWDKKRKG